MDEVGRGALAGPVTVGVVVITASIGRVPPGLADSKLLTPAAREALVRPIRRWVTEYAVGHASPAEIDTIGIIAALRHGRSARARRVVRPGGRRAAGRQPQLPDRARRCWPQPCDDPPLFESASSPRGRSEPLVHVRIKADLTCAAVAGASVLAKTERDRLLVELHAGAPACTGSR